MVDTLHDRGDPELLTRFLRVLEAALHQSDTTPTFKYSRVQYAWQKCYLEALMETDKVKLAEKLAIARHVIHSRVLENNTGPREQQAIQDALNAMKALD